MWCLHGCGGDGAEEYFRKGYPCPGNGGGQEGRPYTEAGRNGKGCGGGIFLQVCPEAFQAGEGKGGSRNAGFHCHCTVCRKSGAAGQGFQTAEAVRSKICLPDTLSGSAAELGIPVGASFK